MSGTDRGWVNPVGVNDDDKVTPTKHLTPPPNHNSGLTLLPKMRC